MSDKNTCSSCKYWIRTNDKHVDETLGNCKSDKFIYDPWSKGHPSDVLVYSDYEGYSAGFCTGQDFGCIHWEKHN
jgi:hypothetical protein